MPRLLPTAFVSAACLLGLSAAPGCIIVTDGDWSSSNSPSAHRVTRSQTAAHVPNSPLKVSTDNGDITLRTTTAPDVSIVAKLKSPSQERLDRTEVFANRQPDGTLDIGVKWPDGKRQNNEGCAFEIQVPDVHRIRLETGNGDIEAAGFAGPADVATSNGDVELTDHRGPVKAVSSNGDIVLTRVESAEADTSNGDIEVRLSGAGPVSTSTSNGSITITVGPAFAGTISASTSNGTVKSRAARGVAVGTATKTRGEWKFSDGPVSKVSTSNGSVTIND